MLQMKALVINENTYPIAAALLKGGFLTVPEEETYGCIVVINQVVSQFGETRQPITGSGAARRARFLPVRTRYAGSDRAISFENSWYDKETFEAEFTSEFLDKQWTENEFWNVKRKPEPTYEHKTRDFDEVDDECEIGSDCRRDHGL
jgi:hypothetical protein